MPVQKHDPVGFDAKLFSTTKPHDLILLVICLLIPLVLMICMNRVKWFIKWVHGKREDKQGLLASDAQARSESASNSETIGRVSSCDSLGELATDTQKEREAGGQSNHRLKGTAVDLPDLEELDLQSPEAQADEEGVQKQATHGGRTMSSVCCTHLRSVLAGVSIASVCLPDAISFSFLAGTSPLNGIWAGTFMSLCSATVGGRPGMISSASGATAIILARVKAEGLNHSEMCITVLIAAVVQGICAVFRLARFIYIVPHSVIIGFVNGLAVVIFRSQLRQFYTEGGTGPMVDMMTFWGMLVTAALAILTTLIYPRIPYLSKYLPLPPAFVAVVICFIFAYAIEPVFPPRSLIKVAGKQCFEGGWHVIPHWYFPPPEMRWTDHETWRRIVPIGIRFGLAGLIESILTELLIDQITETQGSTARESFAQSLGNLLSGFFGLQGGCALVGQSLMNVANGGVSRVAGVATSMTLLASVVILSEVIGMIPVACLMGLIFLITFQMFDWGSFRLCWNLWKAKTLGTRVDASVIVLVTVITIIEDLATAVIIGCVVASVGYAWNSTKHIKCEQIDEEETCTLKLHGKLFFASALRFQLLFAPSNVTKTNILVDFTNTLCLDFSAINAIETLRDRFQKVGKNIVFKSVPEDFIRYLPADIQLVDKNGKTVGASPLQPGEGASGGTGETSAAA